MRAEKELKISSPLPEWVMFVLPLALPLIQSSLWASVGLYAGTILLFIVLTHRQTNLWRLNSYIVNLVLFTSTLFSYLYLPEYHIVWTLLSLFLSAGWRWGLNVYLSRLGVPQYRPCVFSSALFMHSTLAYLLIYLLMGALGYEHQSITQSWIPIGIIIIAGFISSWRLHDSQKKAKGYSCPEDSPLVRMAIVRDDEVWLTSRPYTGCFIEQDDGIEFTQRLCCKQTDQPLTSCIRIGEAPEDALDRAIKNSQLKSKIPPKHLLRYTYESEQGSRDVHLFVINIRPREGALMLSLRGRFYSPHEIDELSKLGMFSDLFLQEYNYLSQTLFPANALAKAHTKRCK